MEPVMSLFEQYCLIKIDDIKPIIQNISGLIDNVYLCIITRNKKYSIDYRLSTIDRNICDSDKPEDIA